MFACCTFPQVSKWLKEMLISILLGFQPSLVKLYVLPNGMKSIIFTNGKKEVHNAQTKFLLSVKYFRSALIKYSILDADSITTVK